MKKVLFTQAEYRRKKEFTILTTLNEENGNKYITKEAIYPEGKKYIQSIYDNYKLLKDHNNKFELPSTTLQKDVLKTEYIDGPNLAANIEKLLIEGQIQKANEQVAEFIKFLNSIPTKKTDPYKSRTFVSLFDPKHKHEKKIDVECWYPGFHDINFDNFVKKSGDYYFVDFEWCFDFPIPRDYLILRSVFYLSLKLGRIINGMVSDKLPCVSFFPNVLTPVEWINQTNHSNSNLQQMFDYEHNIFSRKIRNYEQFPEVIDEYMENIFTTAISTNQHKVINLQSQVTSLTIDLENEREIREGKDIEIQGLNQKIESMEQYINFLSSKYAKFDTKVYRMFEKLESTKIAQFRPLRKVVRKILTIFSNIKSPRNKPNS